MEMCSPSHPFRRDGWEDVVGEAASLREAPFPQISSPEERQAALDKLSAEDIAVETDAAKKRASTLDASRYFICINSALRSMNAVPNFLLPLYRNDSNCKDAFKPSATCPRYPPPDTLHNYQKDTSLNK